MDAALLYTPIEHWFGTAALIHNLVNTGNCEKEKDTSS